MARYIVNFEPLGRRGRCEDSDSLLTLARKLGVGIVSICAGKGTCHSCKLRITTGIVSKPSAIELKLFSRQELEDGWRLACQTYPRSNVTVSLPDESLTTPQRMQIEGLQIAVPPEPLVRAYQVKLAVPTLSDPQADADRLLESVNRQHRLKCDRADIELLRNLSPQLRAQDWQCQATVRVNEVLSIGPWPSRQLGLAVDLGTTKIAGYLVDLNDGHAIATKAIMNPQISYGEDIISRITTAVNSPSEGIQLQRLALEALKELAADLCTDVEASPSEIVEAVVVGNTAMHHLFLGLPVVQLAYSPFVPTVSMAMDIKARDLGLHFAPGSYVHLLPNIAGFIGGDHVAMLLATLTRYTEGTQLAVDIGTNTEVSLIANGQITSVSCASGPAFEGGHIKDGMRAASGAIERLRLENDRVEYYTIDGEPPVGICGSGILDAMAQLYLHGVIDERGQIKDNHPRVRTVRKQREFVLVDKEEQARQASIVITQQDIRQLQLAKAAIRTGIQILLEKNDATEGNIKQIIIAGAFGSYIDVASAITIGMLPPLPQSRFRQVGNAAGMGAQLALVSCKKRTEGKDIASRVRYIELSTAPNFMQTFMKTMCIGAIGQSTIEGGLR